GVVRKNPMPIEDCDNGIDDDGDGLIDLDDPDCQECPCDGECPDFALYFTNLSASNRIPAAGQVDARGRTGFAISSRNASRLLAVQFGARSTAAGGVTYQFAGDIGTDPERLVEILMVDAQGGNIAPETPNTIITDALAIQSIERGAAVASFAGGDYLEYDLDPGVGGPGFFVGYTSDMDDDANAIPITTDCDLNEILVVNIGGGAECPDNAFYFGGVATEGSVDARGETSFLITSRNAQALLAFSFGVSTTTEAGGVRYEFADDIGIDSDRLVEVLMTNIHGDEIFPATPNTLLASSGEVVAVERASDLAPFAGGDFLQWDGDPGVGGPGFFVGYVSDLDDDVSQIPATPPGDAGNCPLNELLIIRLEGGIVCPDYGLFFGDQPTAQTLDATGEPSAVVSCRNAEPLLAFQFGVSVTGAAGVYTYEFSGDLGTDSERLVEILMTEADGDSVTPQAVNKLQNDTDAVLAITRGAAVAPFAGGDFLEYDLDPGVGGPGFFVGYVSDMDDNVNVIPATAGEGCPLNEILVLHFAGVEQPFSRGDADVNGKVNISDAVWIIQILFGSFVEKVDCDDALDANDDGSLNIDDAMIVLAWMFQRGEALPPPFLTCGVDETPDGLDCRQSNCIVD
ncbi:MAG: hypothetical protein JW876_06960, partial [Candidatus Krumholzibacteriota bacterium]|nr:hypothetical protein [Candidatus Krumholzibacteriota bacterium]